MRSELDVLRDVCARFERAQLDYMLTGSLAAGFYAAPRMTRDIDMVVALDAPALDRLRAAFEPDYLVPSGVEQLARVPGMFNLLELESLVKVDVIVRKDEPFRLEEFDRRRRVELGGFEAWIASAEDIVLSKLVWSRDSRSELQRRDVRQLLAVPLDWNYLERWAADLGVAEELRELRP